MQKKKKKPTLDYYYNSGCEKTMIFTHLLTLFII
jgi:hypothetical protein